MLTSSESHVLDVVKVLADGVPGTTTECLIAWVTLRCVGALRKCETVHNDPKTNSRLLEHRFGPRVRTGRWTDPSIRQQLQRTPHGTERETGRG